MTEKNILTISVIIPTYNRSHIVGRAIQSVLDQTYKDIEVVIVDDGSTDDTRQQLTLLGDDRIRYFYQPHLGEAVARNKGCSVSCGKYVHFLDSDDYFLPNNIEEKFKILEENPEAGWVFSDCYYLYPGESIAVSRNKNINKLRKELLSRFSVFELLLMNYFVNMDTVMFRRECVEKIGGFDEGLTSFIDMDFFYRMARLYKARFIDAPLAVVSHQELDSVTTDFDFFYKGRVEVIEKTKKLFPEETKRIGFPGRRVEADILNYMGMRFLHSNKEEQAIAMFLKSIRSFPFQKRVYLLFFTALFRIVNRRHGIPDSSK